MIAINTEMPKSCCEFHKDTDMVLHCPLYNSCDKRATVRVNFKPIDCPLVEIVTCKDCKHYKEIPLNSSDEIIATCKKNKDRNYHFLRPNFYCADAERRE